MAKLLTNHVVIQLPPELDKKALAKLCRELSIIHGGRIMASSKSSMIHKTGRNGTLVHVEPTHGLVFFQQSVDHLHLAAYRAGNN